MNAGLLRISPGQDSMLSLWFAYPDELADAALVARSAALLTPDERARWQRYRFERDRRQFLATRALVRTALS
ncbi:MAG: hypothetical protein WCE75_14845, partial [Terracidiphilus sp.]